MPKLKTKSGAAKRFKKTGSGTFKFRRANRSHILTKKSSKRKRHLKANSLIDATSHDHIQQCMPHA
jgi:large subunit ribosomal protein L35